VDLRPAHIAASLPSHAAPCRGAFALVFQEVIAPRVSDFPQPGPGRFRRRVMISGSRHGLPWRARTRAVRKVRRRAGRMHRWRHSVPLTRGLRQNRGRWRETGGPKPPQSAPVHNGAFAATKPGGGRCTLRETGRRRRAIAGWAMRRPAFCGAGMLAGPIHPSDVVRFRGAPDRPLA
jgi:hypothetical protein